jgi:hypothetical protein
MITHQNNAKIIYITQYFPDKVAARRTELLSALHLNLKRSDRVVLLSERRYSDAELLLDQLAASDAAKLEQHVVEDRLTFGHIMAFIDVDYKAFKGDRANRPYYVFGNADMVMDKSFAGQVQRMPLNNTMLALQRWDKNSRGGFDFRISQWPGQDVWVVRDVLPATETESDKLFDIKLGQVGSVQLFAALMHDRGYRLSNPGRTVKTLHFHDTDVRNYDLFRGLWQSRKLEKFRFVLPT